MTLLPNKRTYLTRQKTWSSGSLLLDQVVLAAAVGHHDDREERRSNSVIIPYMISERFIDRNGSNVKLDCALRTNRCGAQTRSFYRENSIIQGIQCQMSISEEPHTENSCKEKSTFKLPSVSSKNLNYVNIASAKNKSISCSDKKDSPRKKITLKRSAKRLKEKINIQLHKFNRSKAMVTPENNINSSSKPTLGCNNKRTLLDSEKRNRNIISISPQKRKRIYYSEKQSCIVNGLPSVPPSTPAYIYCETVESLADVKSQRNIIQKLLKIENRQREKEKVLQRKVKESEERRKAEELEKLIKTQRNKIYLLNAIMTNYENKQFLEFKSKKSGAPV